MSEKQEELGALWIKQGPKGEYLTGTIGAEKTKVVAFKNTNKKNPNEPDWRILKSIPRDVAGASSEGRLNAADDQGVNHEDIPF